MPQYKVRMARITWATVTVEADDELDAIEKAPSKCPALSPYESGSQWDPWKADAGEWTPLDEFYQDWKGSYDEAEHGPVAKLADNAPDA